MRIDAHINKNCMMIYFERLRTDDTLFMFRHVVKRKDVENQFEIFLG